MAQKSTEGQGLPTDCWSYVHFFPAALGMTCDQQVESPSLYWGLDRNCRCISVGTQIPRGAVFAPILYNGQKFLPYRNRTSAMSLSMICKCHVLNRVTTAQDKNITFLS